MSNELPPLPHPVTHILLGDDSEDVFTADQMRDFARAAVLQEREECARLCEDRDSGQDTRMDGEDQACAAAIRARSTK